MMSNESRTIYKFSIHSFTKVMTIDYKYEKSSSYRKRWWYRDIVVILSWHMFFLQKMFSRSRDDVLFLMKRRVANVCVLNKMFVEELLNRSIVMKSNETSCDDFLISEDLKTIKLSDFLSVSLMRLIREMRSNIVVIFFMFFS